jgi:hypothetical protein
VLPWAPGLSREVDPRDGQGQPPMAAGSGVFLSPTPHFNCNQPERTTND